MGEAKRRREAGYIPVRNTPPQRGGHLRWPYVAALILGAAIGSWLVMRFAR